MKDLIEKYHQKDKIEVKELVNTYGEKTLKKWGLNFEGEFLVDGSSFFKSITSQRLFTILFSHDNFKPSDDSVRRFVIKFSRTQLKILELEKDTIQKAFPLYSAFDGGGTPQEMNEAIRKQKERYEVLIIRIRRELLQSKGIGKLWGIFDR